MDKGKREMGKAGGGGGEGDEAQRAVLRMSSSFHAPCAVPLLDRCCAGK